MDEERSAILTNHFKLHCCCIAPILILVLILTTSTCVHTLTHTHICSGGIVDCQERGLREEDWNDPIDSREEGTQKYATTTSAANAKIAAIHSASASASASVVPSSTKKAARTSVTSASSLIAKAASDFGSGKSASQKSSSNSKGKAVDVPVINVSLDLKKSDDELRKTILNAPRRISKIESSIAKHEVEIKKIDEEMIVVSRLFDLVRLRVPHHLYPLHCITSYHITSYNIISHYIISNHITSYHITSYHII